jgi:hypothetical protein
VSDFWFLKPRLNPLDCFAWGYIFDKIYNTKYMILSQLKTHLIKIWDELQQHLVRTRVRTNTSKKWSNIYSNTYSNFQHFRLSVIYSNITIRYSNIFEYFKKGIRIFRIYSNILKKVFEYSKSSRNMEKCFFRENMTNEHIL